MLKQGIPFGSFVLPLPYSFLKEQDSVAEKYFLLWHFQFSYKEDGD